MHCASFQIWRPDPPNWPTVQWWRVVSVWCAVYDNITLLAAVINNLFVVSPIIFTWQNTPALSAAKRASLMCGDWVVCGGSSLCSSSLPAPEPTIMWWLELDIFLSFSERIKLSLIPQWDYQSPWEVFLYSRQAGWWTDRKSICLWAEWTMS